MVIRTCIWEDWTLNRVNGFAGSLRRNDRSTLTLLQMLCPGLTTAPGMYAHSFVHHHEMIKQIKNSNNALYTAWMMKQDFFNCFT